MPTQTVIVVAGIILVFAIFAMTMAWVDCYTRRVRTLGAQYFDKSEAAE